MTEMGVLAQESSVAGIDVPTFRVPLFHICLYTLVIFFVGLAIYLLAHFASTPWYAIVASIVWLVLVAFYNYVRISDDGGIQQYFLNCLAAISRRHFVEADATDNYPPTIRFGFTIFTNRFNLLEIPLTAVSSVDWHTGQASGLASQDRNDWQVTIWYHHPDGPQRQPFPDVRDEELHFVGGDGPKTKVEPFGQAFVAFLQGVGVDLKPTGKPTEFTRTGKPTAT